MKKEKSQLIHAQRRCRERYGLTLGTKAYDDLCGKLQDGGADCVFLEKQSNRISLFAVWYEDEWVPVVYDKIRHTIATFLPKEALDQYKHKLVRS